MKNTTKRMAFVAIGLSLCLMHRGFAQSETASDTVIINFGNKSKIVVHISDPEDMETLLTYDINRMLQDLKTKIDQAEEEVDYLKIEDKNGEHYLKEDSINSHDYEQDQAENLEEDNNIQKSIVIEAPGIKPKDRSKSKHSINIELGINNYLKNGNFSGTSSENYAVKPFGSWYVGITSKRKSKVAGPLFIEWGGGISWYNFKLEDPEFMIVKGQEGILFEDSGPDINGIKSKLTASFINVSFVPLLDFSHGRGKKTLSISEGPIKITKYNKEGFRIGFGPYAGYRLASHTKFKYNSNESGGTEKDKDRGSFHLNNFRYGLRFQIGYKGLDLFANYDLNPLFEKNHGPELNAFSFGIVL